MNVPFLSLCLLAHSFNEVFLTRKMFSVDQFFLCYLIPFSGLKKIYSIIFNGLIFCMLVCVCVCRLPFSYSLTLMFLLSVAQFVKDSSYHVNIRATAFKSIHSLGWKNLLVCDTYHMFSLLFLV